MFLLLKVTSCDFFHLINSHILIQRGNAGVDDFSNNIYNEN